MSFCVYPAIDGRIIYGPPAGYRVLESLDNSQSTGLKYTTYTGSDNQIVVAIEDTNTSAQKGIDAQILSSQPGYSISQLNDWANYRQDLRRRYQRMHK
jgi:hypothetical protein